MGCMWGQSDMEALDVRGKTLGEDKIIGVTAKTVEQALKAQAHGADYWESVQSLARHQRQMQQSWIIRF